MATNIKFYGFMQGGNGVPTHISDAGSLFFNFDDGTLYQNKNGVANWTYFLDSGTPIVSPTANTFTTGATLISNTVYFDRNDVLSAYTVDLSSISSTGTSRSNGYMPQGW